MDQSQTNHYQKLHTFLKKTLQFLLPISLFSFLFSHSSIFSHFNFHFSTFAFPLFTHAIVEKKYIFLLFNGILAFLMRTEKSNEDDHMNPPISNLEEPNEEGIEKGYSNIEEKGGENGALIIDGEGEYNEKEEQSESFIRAPSEEEHEKGYLDTEEEEEEERESGALIVYGEYEYNEEEGQSGSSVQAPSEEEETNEMNMSTEELNRKIEEFIRKMKEEIKIEAQRQGIAVQHSA